MIKVMNVVSVTLLIAVVSVFPAALLGRYVPGIFDPGLKSVAVAAWLSGLVSWWVSKTVTLKQQEAAHQAAKQSSGGSGAVGVTVAFLAVAVGLVIVLHFYGDGLLR